MPDEIHFKVKRYGAVELPKSDEGIQNWCMKIWNEKEDCLKKFYMSPVPSRAFEGVDRIQCDSGFIHNFILWFSVSFWFTAAIVWIYWIITLPLVFLYVVIVLCSFAFVERHYGGFEKLQILLAKKSVKV